jgi:hypothetical protein
VARGSRIEGLTSDMLVTVLSFLLSSPAQAEELTVDQAVAAGLPAQLPQATPRGSEDCRCIVLDYGDKGTLKLTADQVTTVKRVTGNDPALYAVVGDQSFRLAGGLCERVALVSMSVGQWLKKDLAVVDSAGRPSSGGCNAIPSP